MRRFCAAGARLSARRKRAARSGNQPQINADEHKKRSCEYSPPFLRRAFASSCSFQGDFMTDLSGRVYLVTGAKEGIGAQVVRGFARRASSQPIFPRRCAKMPNSIWRMMCAMRMPRRKSCREYSRSVESSIISSPTPRLCRANRVMERNLAKRLARSAAR